MGHIDDTWRRYKSRSVFACHSVCWNDGYYGRSIGENSIKCLARIKTSLPMNLINVPKATVENAWANELIPVEGHDADGCLIVVETDEVVRADSSVENLAKLRPAFNPKGGTVTAGNSSAISDGAAALLIMSAEKADELGLKPVARIVSTASAGCEPSLMGRGPVPATKKALKRAGLTLVTWITSD